MGVLLKPMGRARMASGVGYWSWVGYNNKRPGLIVVRSIIFEVIDEITEIEVIAVRAKD